MASTSANSLGKVINTKHQAIELRVTRGELDAGGGLQPQSRRDDCRRPDYKRDSVIFWTSDPLPNDAVAVSATLAKTPFVAKLRGALEKIGPELKDPELRPPRYTGFVAKDNSYYRPIRDAGPRAGSCRAIERVQLKCVHGSTSSPQTGACGCPCSPYQFAFVD